MSVLCCRVPDFLLALAYRHQPEWRARPVALLGPDGLVWAASSPARQCGVHRQMQPRQAQMRCPDIVLQPVATQECQAEQNAFLATLARWDLPVEELGWGLAYVDVHRVATSAIQVEPLAAELGRAVRQELGETLQPALGWDSGKFTARAAAACTQPGRMRLVDKAQEVPFLSVQPIALLPLSPAALQQLHWLGIDTLGQFARLPAAGVLQRFGPAGQLAQRWAQGRDERPVCAGATRALQPIDVDLDPPADSLAPVVTAVGVALRPHLQAMAAQLEGCRHLRIHLRFAEGSAAIVDATFVEPVSQEAALCTAIQQRLQAIAWPAELTGLSIALLKTGELAARQLALLPDVLEGVSPVQQLAQELATRYGPVFFRSEVADALHPLAERRSTLHSLV